MVLSGSYLFGSKEFLQIVLLVGLVIMVGAGVIVTYLHYRRKKNESELNEFQSPDFIPFAVAGLPVPGSNESLPAFINQGHLAANKEKHISLAQQFTDSEQQYNAINAAVQEKAGDENSNELKRQMKQLEMDHARLKKAIEHVGVQLVNEENVVQAQKLIGEKEQELQRLQHILTQQNKELHLQQQKQESQAAEISKLEHQLTEMRESAKIANHDARESGLSMQDEIEHLKKLQFDEKLKWEDELKHARETFKKLEEENLALQDQLLLAHAVVTDKESEKDEVQQLRQSLHKAEAKAKELGDMLASQGYLGEILQEKKMQVDFLQNQLEQRIRTNHDTETQFKQTSALLETAQKELGHHKQLSESLQQELNMEQQEIVKLQSELHQQLHEGQRRQEAFDAKVKHIAYLDEKMNELLQYNHNLEHSIEEQNHSLDELKREIQVQHEQVRQLEIQLQSKQQSLSRIYDEIGQVIAARQGPEPFAEPEQKEVSI